MTATTTERPDHTVEDRPSLHGSGPVEVSTCRALSVVPAYIWDVNGYYRELGVSPYATRSDLGRAYMAADGQSSDRLTFVYKQLIHADIRKAYDRCELGERFMDEWIQRELYLQMKRAAMAKADEEVRSGRLRQEGEYEQVVDSIMDWLISGWENGGDNLPDVLDGEMPEGHDDSAPAKAHKVFPYSYYLWKTLEPEDAEHRLAEWQRLLLQAFAEQDIVTRFAVGFAGKWRRFVLAKVGYREVIMFDRHLDPDIEVARRAVRSFTS